MKLSLFLALTLLLAYSSSLDWQAAGNMSSQNMSVINSYINANFTMGKETITTLPPKAGQFSDYLNDLWDPAWNVVILQAGSAGLNFDAVLYGYAFRNHWIWINGLILGSLNFNGNIVYYYGGFIIWKDYNCQGWLTINTFSSSSTNTFTSDPNPVINAFFKSYSPKYDDIWNAAWKTVQYFETTATEFKGDHAYTMIISQSYDNYYFGKVCASNYRARTLSNFASDTTHGAWGSYLLLKMR